MHAVCSDSLSISGSRDRVDDRLGSGFASQFQHQFHKFPASASRNTGCVGGSGGGKVFRCVYCLLGCHSCVY